WMTYNMIMDNATIQKLQHAVDSVIRGKQEAVKMAIVTLLGSGHLLIEDVPGVGKTTLAHALARASGCEFHRIQFTSDMMPSDIIGVNIYNPESHEFEFRPGPVFSHIVLADEINRTSPKTQSALLEAMNEKRISVERQTFMLPDPFMVIATQNPIEYHGTFPLPESQLDRFMMHLKLGYPDSEEEKRAVADQSGFERASQLAPVATREGILAMQAGADGVTIEESVMDYLMRIITATRRDDRIRLGASTRGAQFLLKAAKANAYYEGRDFVVPDDIRRLAPLVLGHRLILKTRKFISDAEQVIQDIVAALPVPV
ncbi:MAG TPA: MoxR family ATPase, partial [Thermodesulfovibrionales bacterium]|nr:MoxR family ATPase [Thermodesulfovibrionales bacterium]